MKTEHIVFRKRHFIANEHGEHIAEVYANFPFCSRTAELMAAATEMHGLLTAIRDVFANNCCISCSMCHELQERIDAVLRKVDEHAPREEQKETCFSFDEFWSCYDKKVERVKCERIYARIGESDRAAIRDRLPAYVASTPDKTYRKNPQTWLHGECWNDDVVPQPGAADRTERGF